MAVAYDTVGVGRTQTDSGGTFNHTVVAGANLYIILVVNLNQGASGTLSSSSFNSVALARLDSQAQSTNTLVEVWGLKAPSTGTNSLSYTLSAAFAHCAQSFSFTGVDQTTPIGTIAKTSAAGGNPSGLTVNGAASGMFLTTVGGDVASATLTLTTTGSTSRSNQTSSTTSHLGVGTVPGAASISDSWTWSAGVDWAQLGIPLNAAAAATAVPSGLSLFGVGS